MKLSDKQIDALTEVLNIGMGRGAGVLKTMLQSHVSLQAIHIRILALDAYLEQLRGLSPDRLSAVQLGYQGAFSGKVSIDVAEIHGSFDGELTARSQLIIHSTGRVSGKIRYGKLVIAEGGELCGDINALAAERSSVPILNAVTA